MELCSVKTGLNAWVLSVVPDYSVQTAQGNQGRHFPSRLNFVKKRLTLNKKFLKSKKCRP